MSDPEPASAPVLSTPDTRVFEEQRPDASSSVRLSDEQIYITYEIGRVVKEIRDGRRKRVALQFPDSMLVDAPRVFQHLSRGLKEARRKKQKQSKTGDGYPKNHSATDDVESEVASMKLSDAEADAPEKLFILADTSYGSCCVDEVAAEHSSSDVVVHYGRSCLSPTARLPVIYVFTRPPLDVESLYRTFRKTYQDLNEAIVLMADIPYQDYLQSLVDQLISDGYQSVFMTSVVHDTASPLPNRTVPSEAANGKKSLTEYSLFHISDPPPALLLTVFSNVKSIHIYPTGHPSDSRTSKALPSTPTASLLRRRYALLTRLTTAPIIGILINTLSVASYMTMLTHLKSLVASAGKKSYTFVVGKVNAAKIANFAEVGGWVVIGCWESSLFDSEEFWKPVVTPWELELALKRDGERVWTGDWRSDFGAVLEKNKDEEAGAKQTNGHADGTGECEVVDSGEESAPPDFDLRTGRYVSHSRPMAPAPEKIFNPGKQQESATQTLNKRANGDLATIGGEVSPAAEFFKNKRSWQGLGSDYQVEYDEEGRLKDQEAANMEMGRSGIARGYVVGDEKDRS